MKHAFYSMVSLLFFFENQTKNEKSAPASATPTNNYNIKEAIKGARQKNQNV